MGVVRWHGICPTEDHRAAQLANALSALSRSWRASAALDEHWERAVRHEAAGWQISKALGFADWVAAIVVRETPRLTTGENVSIHRSDRLARELAVMGRPRELPGGRALTGASSTRSCFTRITTSNSWLALLALRGPSRPHPKVIDTGNAFATSPLLNSSLYSVIKATNCLAGSPTRFETRRGLACPAQTSFRPAPSYPHFGT